MVVDAIALAAAACYGAAMVLEQHAARAAGARLILRWRLLTALPCERIWLAGLVANVAGYALRLVALDRGSLVVVQSLLSASLLMALPLAAAWHGEHMDRTEWSAAAAIVVGLALFLTPMSPDSGATSATTAGWLAAGAAVLVTTAGAVAAGRRWTWLRPAALAAGGGVLFALAAALMKAVAPVVAAHPLRAPLTWTPYALALVTVGGVFLIQSGFADAPLRRSLPALMVAEPLASVAIGVTLFGERLASDAAARASETAGLALLVAGVWAAAMSPLLARPVEVAP